MKLIDYLIRAPDQRGRVLVLTGLYLGTRINETLALKFGDFRDGEYATVRSLKGSRTRTLSIHPVLLEEINQLRQCYEARHIPVFASTPLLNLIKYPRSTQQPLTRQDVCYMLQRMRQAAHLAGQVTSHSFRKNFTTRLYELLNYDLVALSRYTGHASLDSLQAYIETTRRTDCTQQFDWL